MTDLAKQAAKIPIADIDGRKQARSRKKLFKLFEDQLNIRVNFRIHRMELMTYRQSERETTDEFVNRGRRKGNLCKFGASELDEGIIEPIIVRG